MVGCSKKLFGGFLRGPEVKCNKEWIAKMASEFTSTFLFLFFGCMSCAGTVTYPRPLSETGVNFCAVIGFCVHTFSMISGSHINPSVSFAACLMDILSWDAMLLYWLFQMLGATAGFFALGYLLPSYNLDITPGLCVAKHNPNISLVQGFAAEFCMTFLLIIYCCAIWTENRKPFHDSLPLRFIFVICALVFAGVHYTGASLNIARSFGPALWYLDFNDFYIYVAGTLLGSFLAAIIWNSLWNNTEEDEL